MKVFVYPEKTHEELGEKRWQVSWEQLKDFAASKAGDDVDFDSDIQLLVSNHSTQDGARAAAKKILAAGKPYFGAVTLSEQVVDWYVEEDRVAEWKDCGTPEEIS